MAEPARPTFNPDGTVSVPGFTLPPSGLLSSGALAAQRHRAAGGGLDTPGHEAPIAGRRAAINAYVATLLDRLRGGFPPTLILTGTRALDLSPAVWTNSALLEAAVAATLVVGEGMGHCHHDRLDLPEGRDACGAIVTHFARNLS